MNEFDQNALRAENNPKFYSRFKWLGLGALGFMLYCLYDGYINWPDQQVRGLAYKAIAEEGLTEEELSKLREDIHSENEFYQRLKKFRADDERVAEEWGAVVQEKGWAAEPPEKLRSDGDIVGQYVMAAIVAIIGVWMLMTVWLASGRWIELRDGVIHTSSGQSFPLASVTQIDKRQWRDKGIARVRYDHDGRKGRFVVDDYKYDRKPTDEILARIEEVAGEDKITGGPSEAATEAAAAAAEAADAAESNEQTPA